MSSKIDERVVAMKFNSKNFQAGVAETTSALDRLKSALKLDGSNPNLDSMVGKISGASTAFQTLQTIATGALIAIGAKIVTLGQQIVTNLTNNLTSGARDGFKEYETQINAISTILGNTKSKGENMNSINAALDELNTYSDKTIYNFTEMVSGIKTLTNAGVGLKQGVQVVKGFANAAALAGVSSEEMARGMEFGLNQAIQKGFLGIQDYTSIQGVMGEQFKNSLMETARVHGTNVDALIAKNGSFRDSLSEGWVTSEVMIETLSKFTGELSNEQLKSMGYTEQQISQIQEMAATAVNSATKVRTWTQLLGTMAEQVGSGWANTWRAVIGDSDQATKLFTMLSDEIGGFISNSNEARNSQVELWASLGGRTAIVDAISNAFKALHSVLDPIAEAWAEVFPPSWGRTLATISFAIRDFTAGLILSEDAQANLKMVATALFTVLKFGVDIVSGIVKVLGFFVGVAFDLAGAVLGLIGPILTFVRSFIPVKEGADEATSGVTNFFDMLVNAGKFLTGWLPDAIRNLGTLLNDFLNGGGAAQRIAEFKDNLQKLGDTFAMVKNVLTKGEFTGGGFFEEDSKVVDVLFRIREAIVKVVDAFQEFSKAVGRGADRATSFWSAVGGVIQQVWNFIKPVVDEVGKFFGDITKGLDLDTVLAGLNAGVLIAFAVNIGKTVKRITDVFTVGADIGKSLIEGLDGLVGVLEGYQKKLKADALFKVAAGIAVLAGAVWVLSTIDPARLVSAVTALGTSFGILLGALAILDKIEAEPSIKASVALTLIAAAVNILASAVVKMGALNPEQLAAGLVGIAAAVLILVYAAESLGNLQGDILKSSFALVIMATAISIMAGAVALFGMMPMEMLIQGFIAVAATLALMVAAAVILSKFAPQMVMSAVGLMAMAAALNMLVVPITLLGLLPFPILLQGMITLVLLLGMLVIAALLLSGIAPQMAIAAVGMMAMAAAINMMVVPIMILGAMDLMTLVQGLIGVALVLAMLVVAALAMTGALPGAAAMIAVAGALIILSIAMAIMASIGIVGIITAIIGFVGAVLLMAIVSAILTPLIPVMYGVAGAMGIFALAMVGLALALMIGTLAIGMLGPALQSAVGGITAFAAAADSVLAAAGPMAALGAALIVFGVGALLAGVGALLLGVGLIVLATGLAAVAAVGILGAVALGKVIEKIMGLLIHIPGMLAMGAAMLVLGAGVAVLGVGLLVLSVSAMLAAVALMMLIPLGALTKVAINSIVKSLEKLAATKEDVASTATSLGKLGSAVSKVAQNGITASMGLMAMSMQFTALSVGSEVASQAVMKMAMTMAPATAIMIASIQRVPPAFQQFAMAVIMNMAFLNAGLSSGASKAQATASRMGVMIGILLAVSIRGSYGSVRSSAYGLGDQMIAGMNSGLQNGSGSVSAMAARVARTALNAAKRELDIRSPSRKFRKEVGYQSGAGIVLGLKDQIGAVSKAGKDVGKAAFTALQKSMQDLQSAVATDLDFTPTIRPVFDMTDLRRGSTELNGMLTPASLSVDRGYAMASVVSSERRAVEEAMQDVSYSNDNAGSGDTYVQNIYSPKAISPAEVYRNTKNLISVKKGESPN